MRTWFITGASRGFGAELARHALEQGDDVVATARRPEAVTDALGASDRLLALRLDVTHQPAYLPIGADALTELDDKLAELAAVVDPWRERSIATAHEEAAGGR